MYTELDRHQLLVQILAFVKSNSEFCCLVQIGSGVDGFTDIYSDIDLMAGCMDESSVDSASTKLITFFEQIGTIYIDRRKWSDTVLGLSVYFENGSSVDLSFMPVSEMPIRSKCIKILWAADNTIDEIISQKAQGIQNIKCIVDEHFHHKFFYSIRQAEIALHRQNYIYADIALGEARQMLLTVEAWVEKKKIHQFKNYHTLNQEFLLSLSETYPKEQTFAALFSAKERLTNQYIQLIEKHGLCQIDASQFLIINCFS